MLPRTWYDACQVAAAWPILRTTESNKHDQPRLRARRRLHLLIGLLIARTLSPQRRRLADHWRMETVGAVSEGTFGRYMKRKRFEEVTKYLHFTDSKHRNAKADRA